MIPKCKLVGLTIIYDPKEKIQLIRFARGVDPYWEEGGKKFSWSYGNRFFTCDVDKITAAAEKKKASLLSDSNFVPVAIVPAQAVTLNIRVPSFYALGTIAFRGVRIITMHGDKVIEDGTIVMKDGRFSLIGPVEKVHIPEDAKIVDLPGATVIPGFIDMHLHMRVPPEIFPQQSWLFLTNLAFGVTTARDPSASLGSYGYAELLKSGQMIGPRL